MIKVRLGELSSMLSALHILVDTNLPIKGSYSISRAIVKVEKEYVHFEDSRQKLLTKYAELDEKGEKVMQGNSVVLRDQEGFNKEFNELANTEIEINIHPISLDSLGNIELKPRTLIALEKLVINEEEAE